MEEQDKKKPHSLDTAIGLSIGVLLGVALENIPIGLVAGIGLFFVLSFIRQRKEKDN